MKNKYPFPQTGELVVCRVTNIQRGYVQVALEDYSGLSHEDAAQGMIHISELSNRWVRNISSIVSIGQRVVLSVLRVNESRGYLDLSLRRVNKTQSTSKMGSWKYTKKLEGLLEYFGQQHNTTLDALYKTALFALIDKYGDIRTAFEEIKENGIDELNGVEEISMEDALKQDFYELIIANIQISTINIVMEYDIRSTLGNGVEIIKKALQKAKKIKAPKGVEISMSYIGSPIYRCEITARDFPTAEKHLNKITQTIEKAIGNNGSVIMERDQLSNAQKA